MEQFKGAPEHRDFLASELQKLNARIDASMEPHRELRFIEDHYLWLLRMFPERKPHPKVAAMLETYKTHPPRDP